MPSLSRLPDSMVRIGVVLPWLLTAGCGGLEFGLNRETLDVVKCFASGECEIALGEIAGDAATATSDEPDDAGLFAPDTEVADEALASPESAVGELLGTFTLHENFDSCAYAQGNAYAVPAILRLYLAEQTVRFVEVSGLTIWSGAVYPDDTFDFTFTHADTQGDPDNIVSCACVLTTGVTDVQKDKTACVCEPSSATDENCGLDYIAL